LRWESHNTTNTGLAPEATASNRKGKPIFAKGQKISTSSGEKRKNRGKRKMVHSHGSRKKMPQHSGKSLRKRKKPYQTKITGTQKIQGEHSTIRPRTWPKARKMPNDKNLFMFLLNRKRIARKRGKRGEGSVCRSRITYQRGGKK